MASARSRYRKHHTTISISICSEPSWISTQITRDKMDDKRLCNQVLPLFKNLHKKKISDFLPKAIIIANLPRVFLSMIILLR